MWLREALLILMLLAMSIKAFNPVPRRYIDVYLYLHCDKKYAANVYLLDNRITYSETLSENKISGDGTREPVQHLFIAGDAYHLGINEPIRPFIFIVHNCTDSNYKRRDEMLSGDVYRKTVRWYFDLTFAEKVRLDDVETSKRMFHPF